jgi:hypothetical protein
MEPTNYYNLVIMIGFLGSFLALFSLADLCIWLYLKFKAYQRKRKHHGRYYLGQF